MDFIPLDEHRAVAKSSESLTGGSLKLLDALVDVVDDPHASTAATIGRLQDDRAAVLGDELESLLRSVHRLVGAGDDGEAGGDGGLPGGHLDDDFDVDDFVDGDIVDVDDFVDDDIVDDNDFVDDDCLAATLSPILAITAPFGPMNLMPALTQASAKSDRSDRNP